MLPGKPICFRLLGTVGSPRLARPSGHAAMALLWHQVSLMIIMIGMFVMVMIGMIIIIKTCRVPLQKGAEQGHPDDAGVRQDGDAGQEVDWTPGFRVRRSAGRTYGMAF